jgi:ubiquinone/menaquinone biosynthesis C-methylase UbiE
LREDETEKYWNFVALESEDSGATLRLERWREVARNWLADYADKRARDFISKALREVVKLDESAKILDIGCGPGKWSLMYAKKFSSVKAIDISQKMICLAREKARRENLRNIDFQTMSVSNLEIPDQTYDLVNCVTVLQHIPSDVDWRSAVHEIARVTKGNGYILLFEMAPNFAVKKRTRNLSIRTMHQYMDEFRNAGANLVYWRAVDLSLPITFFGLRNYAASFNKRVYYFISGEQTLPAGFLSFLSSVASLIAKAVDYRLAESPLSFLSIGRILLFQKVGK